MLISEPLLAEAKAHPNIDILSGPNELTFVQGEPQRDLI